MSKKGKLSAEPYKGVRDFYPEDQALLNYILATWRTVVERAGYVEYHASVLEPAELYKSKGAENEELASEQTYTFVDRGGREVTLRPEMTPTVARMVAARRRSWGFPLRLYSIPNVFRYERPQRGRLREHWQLNVDIFGSRSPAADAEILGVAHGIMSAFGARESDFVIKVGSRQRLDAFAKEKGLTNERFQNLRRLLDAKSKMESGEFELKIRALGVELSELAVAHPPREVEDMLKEFRAAGINNIVYDLGVVRGFEYYTGMVFEVFDTHPQNRRALFGGGRYDNLTALFDGDSAGEISGVGFGMGDVTMHDFLDVRRLVPPYRPPTSVYVAITGAKLAVQAQSLAGFLREHGVNVAIDFGEKKLAEQIKTASKHKIPYLIVFGENEIATGQFVVRDLSTGEEKTLSREQLANFFLNI